MIRLIIVLPERMQQVERLTNRNQLQRSVIINHITDRTIVLIFNQHSPLHNTLQTICQHTPQVAFNIKVPLIHLKQNSRHLKETFDQRSLLKMYVVSIRNVNFEYFHNMPNVQS